MKYKIVHNIDQVDVLAQDGWRVHSWQIGANGFVYLMEKEING